LSDTNLLFHGFLIDPCFTVIAYVTFNLPDMALKIRIVVILVDVVLLAIFYVEFFGIFVMSP
jgi:hypothetical protein